MKPNRDYQHEYLSYYSPASNERRRQIVDELNQKPGISKNLAKVVIGALIVGTIGSLLVALWVRSQ